MSAYDHPSIPMNKKRIVQLGALLISVSTLILTACHSKRQVESAHIIKSSPNQEFVSLTRPSVVLAHEPSPTLSAALVASTPQVQITHLPSESTPKATPIVPNVTLRVIPLLPDASAASFADCLPDIAFTYVPSYGSFDDLGGVVSCVDPAAFWVAVYIYVNGWWNKPTFAESLTPVEPDGTWITDITPGGSDENATTIAAFLVPKGYAPPELAGASTLPDELFANAVAYTHVERTRRTITFSGRIWNVKQSDNPVGPGPNYFSDEAEDVWVDQDGRLHLKIVQRDGKWYSTEVFSQEPLGYGTYIFHTASRIDLLDENIVLGLFTWDSLAPEANYREIDVEFSRWGDASNPDNAQFVVQPWNKPGNLHRFNVTLEEPASTHQFTWGANSITFSSTYGHPPPTSGDVIESWVYTSTTSIPPDGDANARINFWLFQGNAPVNGQEAEVIIEAFEFVPYWYWTHLPSIFRD